MLRYKNFFSKLRCNFYFSYLFTKSNKNFSSVQKINYKPSELIKSSVTIEKKSLSRGLALNMFEKDFLIYPEYLETDDVKFIKKYVNKIQSDFSKALKAVQNDDSISIQALQVLMKNSVFSTFINQKYGGIGFNQKDLVVLSETLGNNDLSFFLLFNQAQSAATLISIFGTDQQKQKYLPEIAAFRCKPCICIYDEPTPNGTITQVLNPKGQDGKLNGLKINVINANIADIFIVLAKKTIDNFTESNFYIIDRNDLGPGGNIDIKERIKTHGLTSTHFSKVMFTNVSVNNAQIIGVGHDSKDDLLDELRLNNKVFYGSAVVGFLKKLTKEICEFANNRNEFNLRLADLHPVQSALTNLSIGIFVLESMVYYLAGLCDEDLFLLNDIENSIIQRYSNKILCDAVKTIIDITGMAATSDDFTFDKFIRDLMTFISMTESDLKLVKRITLPTIESYIVKHGSTSNLMAKFNLFKLISGDYKTLEKLKNPKLTHFLAEHVHPSLEPAARALEQSMARIYHTIDYLITDRGIYIKEDYMALRDLATVLENNMGMAATIARASRSYSIGLRFAENELNWTTYYCSMVAKQTENILQETINHFGIVSFNPKLTIIGEFVLNNNGYNLESPIERNW